MTTKKEVALIIMCEDSLRHGGGRKEGTKVGEEGNREVSKRKTKRMEY